ncbi:MAG: hypothetical protein QF921_18430 [Pseudomonadales bacterium]|nr:hypothetical protein [Pseudomonadales bacterium]MDP6472354.1 hypothetical protein [Pseudomonadales bacterium]MDP6828150.1 hypothetical protein [Pseudomonadales bacterium]MDP6973465.1 hypothetical protein [Pseudomonadales bacterium]
MLEVLQALGELPVALLFRFGDVAFRTAGGGILPSRQLAAVLEWKIKQRCQYLRGEFN